MQDNENFHHFRAFFDAAEDSTSIFKVFYHDEALDYDDWEDVTDEFK